MSGCGCRQAPIIIGGCPSNPCLDTETVVMCDILPDGTVARTVLVESVYNTDTGTRVGTRIVDPATGADYTPAGSLGACPGPKPCQHCETVQLCDSTPYRVEATATSIDPSPYFDIANTHAALDPVVAQTILNGGTGVFPADDGTHNGQHTWLAGAVHLGPASLCGTPTDVTISASVHAHNDGPSDACQLYGRFALWNGAARIYTDPLGPPNLPAGGDDNGVIQPTTVPLADVLAGNVVIELNLETGNDNRCGVGPKAWTVDRFALTVQASAPGCGTSFLRTICRDCEGVITSTTDTLDGTTPYTPVPPVAPCRPGCPTTH